MDAQKQHKLTLSDRHSTSINVFFLRPSQTTLQRQRLEKPSTLGQHWVSSAEELCFFPPLIISISSRAADSQARSVTTVHWELASRYSFIQHFKISARAPSTGSVSLPPCDLRARNKCSWASKSQLTPGPTRPTEGVLQYCPPPKYTFLRSEKTMR